MPNANLAPGAPDGGSHMITAGIEKEWNLILVLPSPVEGYFMNS